MVLQPKVEDYPRIRKALKVYKVTSVITGIMLLLLCAVMVMKYVFQVHIFLFTPSGVLSLEPIADEGVDTGFTPEGFDLFRAILIAHGWFYVVYLFSNFMLWSPMRWSFMRFLLLALGGVIPFMSFWLEARTAREVNEFLDTREAALASAPAAHQTSHSPVTTPESNE